MCKTHSREKRGVGGREREGGRERGGREGSKGAQKKLRSRVKGTSVHKCTFVLTHFHQYSHVLEICVPVHKCTNVPIHSCPSVSTYLKTGYTNGRTCKNTTEVGGRKRDGEREREREGERWHKRH